MKRTVIFKHELPRIYHEFIINDMNFECVFAKR